MNENKKDLLLTLLKESVEKCYCKDNILIQLGMEQASVARIFYYMQELIICDTRFRSLKKYNLDSEYNKIGQATKRTPKFTKGVRPDIILHNRGENKPRQNNVLIVEFKPKGNSKKIIDGLNHDRHKLEEFTDRDCGYNYFIGVSVKLNKQGAEYKYFQGGKEKEESDLHND